MRKKVIKEFARVGDETKIQITQLNNETFRIALVSPTAEKGIEDFFSTLTECYLALLEDPKWQMLHKRLTLEHLEALHRQIQVMMDNYHEKACEAGLGNDLWGIFQSMHTDLLCLRARVEDIIGKRHCR